MKKTLLISCIIISLFVACNNKSDNQKTKQTTKNQIDTSLMWVDYRLGALPPQGAYDGIDTLVKKYKLRYQRIEAGCDLGPIEKQLKAKYDKQNLRYFSEMEKVYGKDWKKKFDAKLNLLDSINYIQIAKQQDSLNRVIGIN